MKQSNILGNIPSAIKNEISEIILNSKHIRIERIISNGQVSPENFWYDQDENEWVMVLNGKAKLKFENDEILELETGDYVNIPAHKKHKVIWTNTNEETIWLAVFYS
ncbi:MAG: cupin domain-containing protein [Ignavibacteriaceae bacterium]